MEARPLRISIVEDDEAVRDSLQMFLEMQGFTVTAFASPVALLERPEAGNCDCLILDMHMPNMSGLELMELLRNRGIRTPAMLITGNDDPNLEARMKRVGIAHLFRKPVLPEQLMSRIETLVG